MKRAGKERVRQVVAKSLRGPRTLTIVGGPVPMTSGLAELMRAAIDEQRDRERKRAP